jgi:hypothetical protein
MNVISHKCLSSPVRIIVLLQGHKNNVFLVIGIKCTNRSASSFLGVIAFAINVVPVQVFTGCSAA